MCKWSLWQPSDPLPLQNGGWVFKYQRGRSKNRGPPKTQERGWCVNAYMCVCRCLCVCLCVICVFVCVFVCVCLCIPCPRWASVKYPRGCSKIWDPPPPEAGDDRSKIGPPITLFWGVKSRLTILLIYIYICTYIHIYIYIYIYIYISSIFIPAFTPQKSVIGGPIFERSSPASGGGGSQIF